MGLWQAEVGDSNPYMVGFGYGSWILTHPSLSMVPDELPEETPILESLVEYEIEEMEVEVAPQVDAGDAPEDAGDAPEDAQKLMFLCRCIICFFHFQAGMMFLLLQISPV